MEELVISRAGKFRRAATVLLAAVVGCAFGGRDRLMLQQAGAGHWTVVRILIELGANVRAVDVHGQTLLHKAVKSGSRERVRSHLKYGFYDPNSRGAHGMWSAVECAVRQKQVPILEDLLNAGGRAEGTNNDGRPLSAAIEVGSVEAARVLVAAGAKIEPGDLHIAARHDHVDMVKFLLLAGGKPGDRNGSVNTALHVLCGYGSVEPRAGEIAQILLEAGADPNAVDERGLTAIREAVDCGNLEVVRILVGAGARVDAVTSRLAAERVRNCEGTLRCAEARRIAVLIRDVHGVE